MNITLLKNATVYAPEFLGKKDLLVVAGKIIKIDDQIDLPTNLATVYDLEGQALLPGFIDQHIHLTGAGGMHAFNSMTEEVILSELIACGTTTVVGLLGTDGSTRSLHNLYAKTKSLDLEGISAYMFTNYYGYPTLTITESVKNDLIFIDKIIGCKIAISDIRSSYPTAQELARLVAEIHVGGLISGKGGILHIHLGNLKTGMDLLFELVKDYQIPVKQLSPTHVGRTKDLFEQAIEFAKIGGMIDITTGASKFDEPYKQVLYALSKGVSIEKMTFSSDGHAGLIRRDSKGIATVLKAPIDQNLAQVIQLIKEGGIPVSDAFKLITANPADNLQLKNKGRIKVGLDADFCVFDENWNLNFVMANGKVLLGQNALVAL